MKPLRKPIYGKNRTILNNYFNIHGVYGINMWDIKFAITSTIRKYVYNKLALSGYVCEVNELFFIVNDETY